VLSDSGTVTVAGSGAGGTIAAADRPLGLGNERLDGGYGSSGASALAGSTRVRPRPRARGEAYALRTGRRGG
jgi:hypothetical protein